MFDLTLFSFILLFYDNLVAGRLCSCCVCRYIIRRKSSVSPDKYDGMNSIRFRFYLSCFFHTFANHLFKKEFRNS